MFRLSPRSPMPLLVLVALLVAPAAAQRLLMPEDVANLETVSDPRLSPDGEWVVYVQRLPRAADEEGGASRSMLWLQRSDGGEAIPFTTGQGRATEPRWSPDGGRIAFLDRRPYDDKEAEQQVFVIPVDGGEAEKVSELEEGVVELAWAPDGEALFLTARDPKSEERKEEEKKGRDWEVFDQDYRHLRLYRLDLETGEAKLVSEAELTLREIAVSPDGGRVAALGAKTPKVDDSYMFQELVTVEVATGEVETIWDPPGKAGMPRWSPDGEHLALLAGIGAFDPMDGSLFVVASTGGEARNLTPDYPGTVEWLDFDGDASLIFVATHGTQSQLRRVSLDGESFETFEDEGPVYTEAHLGGGARVAVAASTPEHPPEIFVRSLDEQADWSRLTESYPHLDGVRLGRQETVEWQARDGLTIEGVLVYPLDYREGERYPLVVGVHGGPESAIRNGWHTGYGYLSQLLAHRGALFLMPNYRGSTGRGVEFLRADHGDPLGAQFQDALDGIQALIDRGMVDGDRVGMMGGSYGGYFSAWAATKESAHFRAAVVNFGVTNLWSDWGDGDIPYEHRLVHWGWFPVDRPFLAVDRSPVTWVRNSRTATLIMHGKEDTRVPAAQSRELYNGLRLNEGLPVEMVFFPREGHGYGEAPHRLEACRRALEWMVRYLELEAVTELPSGP